MDRTVSVLVGKVLAIDADAGTATLDVGTGTVQATLTDSTASVGVGATGTLLLLPAGYQLISTRSSGTGDGLGPELVPNGGFEWGLQGWGQFLTSNCQSYVSEEDNVEGTQSLKVTVSPGGDTAYTTWVSPSSFRIDADFTYRVSCWARSAARSALGDLSVNLSAISAVNQWDAAPLATGAHLFPVENLAPSATWALYEGLWTVPSGDRYATPVVQVFASADVDIDVFIDAISIRRKL